MDRKEEIIRLQTEIIRGLARQGLNRVGLDLWAPPPLPPAKPRDFPEVEAQGPPPGYPPVPDVGLDEEGRPAPSGAGEKATPPESMDELKKELHGYIGLDLIKQEVDSLINLVTVNSLRKQHGLTVQDLSLHMVFSGNPGTGKTMVARLMSRIYRSLGILSRGHLVEVDRSGLVAGFVGQTALKTAEVIKKALGGVLFIDEAYALTTRGINDYGQEAVETLLKAMEDHRDDLIVIVAGYTDLMRDFVRSNPGLQSRFNRFMHFPDYSEEELRRIFVMRCADSGYELSPEAAEQLPGILENAMADRAAFGNARGVRNLFERAVSRQANRLAAQEAVTREELMRLLPEDLRDPENSAGEGEGHDFLSQ